jgi:hypothetical protein
MGPDDFEILLRESVYFRSMLVELLHSSEQSLSIVAAAVARQVDAGRFAADPDPTRDRILNAVRSHLQLHRVD